MSTKLEQIKCRPYREIKLTNKIKASKNNISTLATRILIDTEYQGKGIAAKVYNIIMNNISGNTTRINPSTSNIIDLYIVPSSYYTQYQNYVKDVTGTITEPSKPTLNELSQTYSELNNYKMLF